MRTKISLATILLFASLFILGCQDKKNNKTMNEITKLDDNTKLIDGIKFESDFLFDKNDFDLKKYKYNQTYLEDIKIKDLLDRNFRFHFMEYLKDVKTEDDNFKSTLICKLLLTRIFQLSDSNAFYILSEISKEEIISYNGIELYESTLIETFLQNPYLYIQQSAKYKDSSLLDYIMKMFPTYLINEEFLEMNLGYIRKGKNNMLLLKPESIKLLTLKSLVKKIDLLSKIEIQLGPSFYTNFETKKEFFTDISSLFGNDFLEKLSKSEKELYEAKVLSILADFYIKLDSNKEIISDPDGYTNLRKDKNTTSEILQKVQSGEQVEVLDNTGDWCNVKTKEGKIGYIHKSRIKSNNNSVSVLRIYDRADFTSFSKEIQPKGEIEYVNKINGWDFIKVNGRVGYIPTEEQKQEFANRPKRKNSFLAEDEPEPIKKKAFWDFFG
ncbi:SH3 domain-containing protein [Chryseobacterium soldanellicola]|uniref:SH3 domain-containing protein n=1 Tax=Chryseobacterium soldanellicola TaxID=311333 RepID=A0A1H0YNS9_9FLAO|nr:SH3 domain-containing protein [Chryseobacterium soldanellicola]SDQ16897.1 SH3 domain-containing protein [Chryseobacterium soldanellicola]